MAFIPLATTTTLANFRAFVRSQSGTLSAQESTVLDTMLTDVIHNAVMLVRKLAGRLLDQRYSTLVNPIETLKLVDISAYDISDINRMAYYDASFGQVPIVSDQEYYTLQTVYSTTDLANALFAHVTNLLSTDNKLILQVYRGTNKSDSGQTKTLVYNRNPVKASSDSTKMDLPEEYIPIAEDVATVMVLRKIGHTPPADMEARVNAFVQSQLAQIGLTVSPSRS